MKAAQANGGNLLASPAQRPINHFARFPLRGQRVSASAHTNSGGSDGLDEFASRQAVSGVRR